MLNGFFDKLFSAVASLPFDTLMWIIWGSFAFIFVLALVLSLKVRAVRAASKRPFLCLVNAYSAVTLAGFLTIGGLPQAVFAAALFWCAGYVLYGALCFFTRRRTVAAPVQISAAVASAPPQPPARQPRGDMPAAKSSVRLEHAASVTDKLLSKNLAKSDRQELEKLKNTLAVLQMKGTLTPAESEILNENFNALLKLMAKYNV